MKCKTGIELIAEERQRQIDVELYKTDEDAVKYSKQRGTENDLAYAAAAYALPDNLKTNWQKENLGHRSNLFPWDKTCWKPTPENRIRELQKAGALIAAEIDRLNANIELSIESKQKNCKHENIGSAAGIISCLDCGFELVGW